MPKLYDSVKPILEAAAIDLTEREPPHRWVGNVAE